MRESLVGYMCKNRKHVKSICRLKYVSEDKINKLYIHTNEICKNCANDCLNFKSDMEGCQNRVERETLNEIIEMIKDEQVNLIRFCEDYNLKFDVLIDMLRANCHLSYKYYTCIMDRLHMVKDSEEINREYNMTYNNKEVGVVL